MYVLCEYKQEFIVYIKRMFNVCIPCTNTLCKVMTQLPMTAKGVNNIETIKV